MSNSHLDIFKNDFDIVKEDTAFSLFGNIDVLVEINDTKFEFDLFETSVNNEYTLISQIENSAEKNIVHIKEFVQTLVDEHDIKLDLFYYPLTETESVIVLNNHVDDINVIKKICEFSDVYEIILSLDTLDTLTPELKDLGFEQNQNIYINEYILRHPTEMNMNEGVMLFGGLSKQVNAVDLTSSNVQSYTYKEDWFKEYIEMINSDEFKKRRFKETHGVLINRNVKKKRGCVSKVGFAIVGKCKVV